VRDVKTQTDMVVVKSMYILKLQFETVSYTCGQCCAVSSNMGKFEISLVGLLLIRMT